ncbi:MAG TPA: hypothetical protein VFH51_06830, partial [Myxococcota bacterium]|nr:hypothetical protein [Myxococcota bacterium]
SLGLAILLAYAVGCAPAVLGRPFTVDPKAEIKIGHDSKTDVVRKLGQPFRRSVDSDGHEMFVYVWADGEGGGQKCVVAFNKNEVAYVVEVAP